MLKYMYHIDIFDDTGNKKCIFLLVKCLFFLNTCILKNIYIFKNACILKNIFFSILKFISNHLEHQFTISIIPAIGL